MLGNTDRRRMPALKGWELEGAVILVETGC